MKRYMAKLWDNLGWSIAATEPVAFRKVMTDELTLMVWRNPMVQNLVFVDGAAFHPEEGEGGVPHRARGWIAAVVDRYGYSRARCAWTTRKTDALIEVGILLARDYPTFDELRGYEP